MNLLIGDGAYRFLMIVKYVYCIQEDSTVTPLRGALAGGKVPHGSLKPSISVDPVESIERRTMDRSKPNVELVVRRRQALKLAAVGVITTRKRQ